MKKHKAIVKYWDLGRNKANGGFEVVGSVEEINERMYREFAKHLVSRNIGFDEGKIFAGFRCVGNYIVTSVELTEAEQ
jgi:hypothetical protein